MSCSRQGLTLVHFSAQLKPCLTHKNTLHTLNTPYTPPTPPLHTPYTRDTQPLHAPPIPLKALKLSWEVNECMPLVSGEADADADVHRGRGHRPGQGLTLVHFSAQPEPFLTLNTSSKRLNTPSTPAFHTP